MRAEEYLNILTEQIRCKRARTGVMQEISHHIEDQQSFYEAEGMAAAEAECLAVKEMGSPVEAGIELDRIHRPRMAWGLIVLIILISIAGFLVQYLLQGSFESAHFLPYDSGRYLLHMTIGFLVMAGICFLDYSVIRHWAKAVSIGFFVILILQIWLFGITYNGQRSWLRLGSISFDVRQILFIYVPFYGAILYSYRGQGYRALVKALMWMFPPIAIALSCPSITTAAMLAATFLLVLSIAVRKGWYQIAGKRTLAVLWAGALACPFIGSLYLFRFGSAYHMARINAIFGFSETDGGYLLVKTREILSGSHFIGTNPMPIEQMIQGSNDYVLTYMISQYGILAAVLLTGLMVLLLCCMFRAALKQKNQLGMLMGVGCAAALSVQILLYVLGNTGVLLVANYCPFLNYGGSGMLMTYVLLGLLLSICRYENVICEGSLQELRKQAWKVRLVIEKDDQEQRT